MEEKKYQGITVKFEPQWVRVVTDDALTGYLEQKSRRDAERLAEWIQETFPRKKRLRKDAGAHAWRIAIQRYLESKEYIRLFRDGSELH